MRWLGWSLVTFLCQLGVAVAGILLYLAGVAHLGNWLIALIAWNRLVGYSALALAVLCALPLAGLWVNFLQAVNQYLGHPFLPKKRRVFRVLRQLARVCEWGLFVAGLAAFVLGVDYLTERLIRLLLWNGWWGGAGVIGAVLAAPVLMALWSASLILLDQWLTDLFSSLNLL